MIYYNIFLYGLLRRIDNIDRNIYIALFLRGLLRRIYNSRAKEV